MPSIAPLISGWQRRVGGMPGPYSVAPASGVASGGTGPNGLLVELLIDGSWVDITNRVMVRDSSGQISLTRGQSSEGQKTNPGTGGFQLNDRDGLFSPANPLSPYYGKIGRNTQIRISVAKGDDKSYRFWGEVPAWPEDWDITDTDIWVDIAPAGILQRLNQGSTPLKSTLYRGLMSAALTPTPVAYWALEDGSQSTSMASAVGGPAMHIGGTPSLGGDTGFACSAALPTMGGGAFMGTVPAYTVTGQTQLRFLMYLPTAPADGTVLVQATATGGTAPRWAVVYGAGGTLAIQALDTDGTVLANSGGIAFAVGGKRVRVSVELTQSGANVNYALSVIVATTGFINGVNGSFTAQTVGRFTGITVSPGGTLTDSVFGHISVQNVITNVADLAGPVTAFLGEPVTTRLARLAAEEGVNWITVGGLSADTMGPQTPATFLTLVQECIDVDQGVLFERETAFGLAYKPRSALYNPRPALTLSYPGNQLASIPKPVPDAKIITNDVTVSRPSGSSAHAVQTTGPLSTQAPPLGVGTYPDAPVLNVRSDDDLPGHAAWRVHLGTVDQPRYPSISINLAHPSMATQRLAALNVLPGGRIVITNPPSRLGGDISQIVIGITETISHFEHRITFICQPESPYRVATLDDPTYGRLDTAGSALADDMTPASTAVRVAVPAGGATWTVDPGDTPMLVTSSGETMRVDSIGGGIINSNPYLDTDLSGWTGVNAVIAPVTSPLYDIAAHSMLINPDGVSASGGASATRSAAGTITAGISYVACLWAYSPGGWADLRPAVDWSDAGGVFLSSSLGTGFTVPAGTWTFLTQTFVAPASASMASMRARHGGTPPASAVWYAWGLRLLPVATVPAVSPQQFAVTRAVNGVVKTHAVGDDLRLLNPMILAL